MTREQFESTLVEAPEPGSSGEAVFDFRAIPLAVQSEFRYSTVYEWGDDGMAMEECWMAYLEYIEEDWVD